MLKLQGCLKDYIWGGEKLKKLYGRSSKGKIAESWELSVHPDGISSTTSGSLAGYLKNNPLAVDLNASPLPILIKYIDAEQKLSVQVHPNDEYARLHENDNGKTEMWYVVQADDGAGIFCGFNRNTNREEFLQKLSDGTVEELLNFIPVKAGDCILIEAGTLHAIGAGCVICEVQQSSNITYRVFDYNRVGPNGQKRPLHIQKALDVLDFNKFNGTRLCGASFVPNGERVLAQCKYFTCKELHLDGEYINRNVDSFTAINVIGGSGTVNGQNFTDGDCFFVDCGEEYCLCGKAAILLTTK